MIGYTEYKNIKNKKQKGGYPYEEKNKNDIVILNGIKYIRDLDYPNEQKSYQDPINGIDLKQENAILFDKQFYDVESLYSWIHASGSTKTVPLTRRPFTFTEINNINALYNNRNSTNIISEEYNKKFYLQAKNGKYYKADSSNRGLLTIVERIEDATVFVASKAYVHEFKREGNNIYRIYKNGNIDIYKHILYETESFRTWSFMLDENHTYFYPIRWEFYPIRWKKPVYEERLKIIEI